MRIGLINQLNGRPDADTPAPTWMSIHERATVAELSGFDTFVFEDGLLYRGEEATNGLWESVSIARLSPPPPRGSTWVSRWSTLPTGHRR